MNKISEVTRRDLLDIIRDGFISQEKAQRITADFGYIETEEDVVIRMPFYGRLNESDFLARIYDLENMPSTDSRFSNAIADIWQHTVNNDDWEPFWFFTDRRFKLSNGNEDEYLLKFICEMLHPAVRNESSNWKAYLDKINQLLHPDGYELFAKKNISGRDVFAAREIDHVEIVHSPERIYAAMKSLGEGSYARTFKYTDEFYQKDFVLKRAKPDLNGKELTRFKREFEEMHSLRSPYIVEVYTYDDSKHEYTMELMDCTLKDFIDKNNDTLPLSTRKNIIMQLLRAYKYLHSKSVFHRDVSPRNVLLKIYDDVIVVKVSDFGLVKITDSELTSEHSELKGSLNDPSLKVSGFGNYELTHEIYAITLLFVYILTGKLNWAKIKAVPVRAFMEKGTDAVKTKRYQSLDDLGQAVSKCIDDMLR